METADKENARHIGVVEVVVAVVVGEEVACLIEIRTPAVVCSEQIATYRNKCKSYNK